MTSWKISFPCPRGVALALSGDVPALDALDPPLLIVATEPDEQSPEQWRIDAYVQAQPSGEFLALLLDHAPGVARDAVSVEQLADEDWVTLSQAGLPPVTAGRFYVSTPRDAHLAPAGSIGLVIDAGLAFGTGQHATTTGCLRMIDSLSDIAPARVLDLGTGSAILALAARKLFGSPVVATDIDPVAVEVAARNARDNGVEPAAGAFMLGLADGTQCPLIAAHAPYDLVIANILAGPLIEMAEAISQVVAPGGRLILAGLLVAQADAVQRAYAPFGFAEERRITLGDWPTLLLRRRP